MPGLAGNCEHFQRLFHIAAAAGLFVRRAEIGVADGAGDGKTAQYTRSAHRTGDIDHGADLRHRDANTLYLFDNR